MINYYQNIVKFTINRTNTLKAQKKKLMNRIKLFKNLFKMNKTKNNE